MVRHIQVHLYIHNYNMWFGSSLNRFVQNNAARAFFITKFYQFSHRGCQCVGMLHFLMNALWITTMVSLERTLSYKNFNWSTVHTLQGSPQKNVLTVLTNFFWFKSNVYFHFTLDKLISLKLEIVLEVYIKRKLSHSSFEWYHWRLYGTNRLYRKFAINSHE